MASQSPGTSSVNPGRPPEKLSGCSAHLRAGGGSVERPWGGGPRMGWPLASPPPSIKSTFSFVLGLNQGVPPNSRQAPLSHCREESISACCFPAVAQAPTCRPRGLHSSACRHSTGLCCPGTWLLANRASPQTIAVGQPDQRVAKNNQCAPGGH